jgi:cytochrome c
VDYDGDALHYAWTVAPSGGGSTKQFTGAAPTVTLEQPGRYDVVLTVRDPEGATDRDSVEVVAGNERPMVDIEITDGNRSFYFPDSTIAYTVRVQDHEDGSLHGSGILDDRVTLTAEYLPSGLSPAQLTELLPTGSEASPQMPLRHLQAQAIIAQGTCRTCHRMDEALVGPSFRAVAERYASNEAAKEILSRSLTEGSSGTWGESAMPPQTTLSEAEVTQVVDYILSLNSDAAQHRLPLQSTFTTEGHPNEGGNTRLHRFFDPGFELGAYVLRARYTDKGRPDVEGLVLHGEDRLLLRPPFLGPETADVFSEDGISYTPSSDDPGFIVSGPEAYLGFDQIDLTGIREIHVGALTRFWHWSHFVGGTVELRLGAPDGRLVGEPHRQFRPDSITAADGPFFGDDLDPPVRVDVSGVRGVHDVYVVFRNPDAGSDDALLVITGLAFKP